MATSRELAERLAVAFDRYIGVMINDPAISSLDHTNLRNQLAREIDTALNGAKSATYGK